jgi:hypothetical protein
MLAHEPEAEQGLKPMEKVFSCGTLVSPFSGQVLIANRYLPEKMTNNLCFALSPCGLHKSQISADMLSTYPLLTESPKQEALFNDVSIILRYYRHARRFLIKKRIIDGKLFLSGAYTKVLLTKRRK